ncbi:hypothetical protein DUNSADRAFT_1672 [Dunaliella salina]|uniref:Encoded protein n=1 Tax=Dunaliella salina TaxID=3046 RepID=A0ABQ7GWR2_DUNSA|nr:hypothetical protein DUNSADRAFT_1672 [Dunaliella salina]|eukprot:KAF5839055.1 hypothetical protein DUNSADRAFT_1672 [Dunaliella salina]
MQFLTTKRLELPQQRIVQDPDRGEVLVPVPGASEKQERVVIMERLDHLLCQRCWDEYVPHSGNPSGAFCIGADAQMSKQRRRTGQHASKRAKLTTNYMEDATGEDGSLQPAAIIRATEHGPRLVLADPTRERIMQKDPTWITDMGPLIDRFQNVMKPKAIPSARRQRGSAFAHAPPAQPQEQARAWTAHNTGNTHKAKLLHVPCEIQDEDIPG